MSPYTEVSLLQWRGYLFWAPFLGFSMPSAPSRSGALHTQIALPPLCYLDHKSDAMLCSLVSHFSKTVEKLSYHGLTFSFIPWDPAESPGKIKVHRRKRWAKHMYPSPACRSLFLSLSSASGWLTLPYHDSHLLRRPLGLLTNGLQTSTWQAFQIRLGSSWGPCCSRKLNIYNLQFLDKLL